MRFSMNPPPLGSVMGDFIVDRCFQRIWVRAGLVRQYVHDRIPRVQGPKARKGRVAKITRKHIATLPNGYVIPNVVNELTPALERHRVRASKSTIRRCFVNEVGRTLKRIRHGVFQVAFQDGETIKTK